ncbi:MAG: CD0415/CD1112 family protein [Clostridia bacterium]
MDWIIDSINEWIKDMLVSGIMGNVEGMFDSINNEVSNVANQVGMTPMQWNNGVFSMIQNISNTVIMPIAGMILTFVMCYELIQMIIDRNNLNDFPPSDIFKWIMSICIFIIVYGRMLEIYLMTSLGAIPLATMTCKEWNIGQNYIKSMLALAFQSFLIMVCVGIYAVLVNSIVTTGEPINAIWTCVGYTVLLCFSLFKTGTLSKQIFSAH